MRKSVPFQHKPVTNDPTYFELEVERLGLQEWEYSFSERLRIWADEHRTRHYVPEELLRAWGMELDDADVGLGWDGVITGDENES